MKKGLIIAAAMVLAVCLGVGGTLAYLFVKTDTVTNTFSPSDIDINLEETKGNEFKMIPGVVMEKDPKVSASADIPYYVFVKVEEKNDPKTYLDYSIDTAQWTLLPGESNVYYKALEAGTLAPTSVLKDDIVTTKSTITKTQMESIGANEPQLIFTAYAIQKDGFTPATAWAELNKPAN